MDPKSFEHVQSWIHIDIFAYYENYEHGSFQAHLTALKDLNQFNYSISIIQFPLMLIRKDHLKRDLVQKGTQIFLKLSS